MNTPLTTEKFNWLHSVGYDITILQDGSRIAANEAAGITVLLSDRTMEIRTPTSYYKLENWKGLDLQPFKMICTAFGLVPMTPEARDQAQHLLNSSYAAQFLNELS